MSEVIEFTKDKQFYPEVAEAYEDLTDLIAKYNGKMPTATMIGILEIKKNQLMSESQ